VDVSEFQTHEQPLGPSRHEVLSENIPASSALLEDVGPFHEVFKKGSKIIIGRRGAGKTAVVMGYNSLAVYGRPSGDLPRNHHTKNFNISLSDFGAMHDMLFSVARRVHEKFGTLEEDFASSEHLNEFWQDEIWLVIYKCFYSAYKQTDDPRQFKSMFPNLVDYFEGASSSGKIEDLLLDQRSLSERARGEILRNIKQSAGQVYILIDSMDEFPIRSPMFSRLARGFLKSVHDFNQRHRDVSIILCIPDELESFFHTYSSNIAKDFGDSIKLDWKASELLRLVAHRYRSFLTVEQCEIVPDFVERVSKLDLTKRADLQSFYAEVVQDEIDNSLGLKETSLAYIVRHTQLLPREFIIIFNRAIKNALSMTRSSSYIIDRAVVRAVEESEDTLAKNILAPYATIYPKFLEACDRILPNMPPICSKADLDRSRRQFKGIEDDVVDPWRTLYNIGVLGQLLMENGEMVGTERYHYALFKFNSKDQVNFSNNDKFCFHPLFSRKWGIHKNRTREMKLIYPANVGERWEDII
jgi:hypothetical protein